MGTQDCTHWYASAHLHDQVIDRYVWHAGRFEARP